MKKIYFLLLGLFLFNGLSAQNPADIDPSFNQFNLPLNHYFVDSKVTKSKVLLDGKILLIKGENTLVRLDGNKMDTSFNTGTGFTDGSSSAILNDFAVQPDEKIIIAGSFTKYNGVNVQRLIRLNSDGSIDTSFNIAGVGLQNDGVTQIELQSDGKIIIIADQTSSGGVFDNLKRLNPDGSLDNSFVTVPNYRFRKVAIQPDGKLVVTHNTNNNYSSAINKIARLNTDGSFDTAFTTANITIPSPSDNLAIVKLIILSNNKIVVGGRFNRCNSLPYLDLVRLNDDGSVDTSFNIGAGFVAASTSYRSDYVFDITEDLNNKIIVSGSFIKFNNVNRSNLVRLNVDGTLDVTFADIGSLVNIEEIKSISLFSDQKILISGDLGYKNAQDYYIAKINIDGTRDISFNNICKGFINTPVRTAVQTSNGKILVGGNFHTYNGIKCYGFTRLNYDGSVDNTLNYGGLNGLENSNLVDISAIGLTSDNKIYLGGFFSTFNGEPIKRLVRLNSDGTRDTTFNTGGSIDYGSANPGKVKDILALPNGYVLIAGSFSNYNGTSCYGVLALDNNGNHLGFPDVGQNATCFKMQTDGKILIGLSHLESGNYSTGAIKRFDSTTWGFDTSFVLDPLLTSGSVTSIEIQQDDKIILCGEFVIGGVTKSLVRILSNGALDSSFNFTLQNDTIKVKNIALTPNQKCVIELYNSSPSSRTIMRLNSDGSVDNTFNQLALSSNSSVNLYSQTDGKILMYGYLPNSQGNPGSGLNRLLGEEYNFIQGQNKIDLNNNGCDVSDPPFTNLKLRVSSGANSFDYIANTTGNYIAALTNGTHTITPTFENPTLF